MQQPFFQRCRRFNQCSCIFQKRLLISHVSFVYQVAGNGRGLEIHKDSRQLQVEQGRGDKSRTAD